MSLARFVGGTAAGQEIDVQGPRHKVTRLPGIPSFDITDEVKTIPYDAQIEEYEVHQVKFATGHVHNYAAPVGGALVGVFNNLWHSYRATERLRNEVTELRSQNARLKQQLWREKFKNQFGKYPS